MKRFRTKNFFLTLFCLIVVFSLIACGNKEENSKNDSSNAIEVTITAYDLASDSYITNINVWEEYDSRKRIITKLNHRDRVRMLKRVGDGVFIETSDGKQGWLSYFFVKELVLKEGIPVWDEKTNNFKNQIPDSTKL